MSPQSFADLEKLGRIRLSNSFFLRDFLYSETAAFYREHNVPDQVELAIENGRRLCDELLEPLNATFGRIAIRSGFRSKRINDLCHENGHKCGQSSRNFAGHIWDRPDEKGNQGAMACIVVPWFSRRYEAGRDWRAMAYWIHNHLPYSELQFFGELCAFNIGWRTNPLRSIVSYIEPRKSGLSAGSQPDLKLARWYDDFPTLKLRCPHDSN